MKELKEYPLITRLEQLRDEQDRAALARLRRGLGKRMGTPEMFSYIVPYLPESSRDQENYFLIASLFAMHPAKALRGVSLGSVFRSIWEDSDSIEKRFTNLLSSDSEDIGDHLRHAVSLAKSKGVPIDYHRLLYDLTYWNHPDYFVQLAWARDFYKNEKQDKDNEKKGEQS